MLKNVMTLKLWSKVTHSIDVYGFLLVFFSNFVVKHTVFEIFDL